jgi:excinuclease ABC subunit A
VVAKASASSLPEAWAAISRTHFTYSTSLLSACIRAIRSLISVLKSLRDLGNTVVVVEHDEMMMREADHIIDMGPLASHLGGEVVATGNYDEIIANPKSLTGKYLSGVLKIETPKTVSKWNRSIKVKRRGRIT